MPWDILADERRLFQWAVPGRVTGGKSTLAWLDALLKRAGYVPQDATCTQSFVLSDMDVWILRYAHPTFAVVRDFEPIPTTFVVPEELGPGRAP